VAGAIDLRSHRRAPIGSFSPAAAFLATRCDDLRKALDGKVGKHVVDGFQRHGFVGLKLYDPGAPRAQHAGSLVVANPNQERSERTMSAIHAGAPTDPDLRHLVERIRPVQ